MRILVVTAVALAVLAFSNSASAQKMGSVNRGAPSISQTITFADGGSITLQYTAISWADGGWAQGVAGEATRGNWRERINRSAKKSPLGKFKSSMPVDLAGQQVAAGEYQVAFKLGEDFKWQLVLMAGETETVWNLNLKKSPMQSKRLILSVFAGETDDSAAIYLAFGDQTGDLGMSPKKAAQG